MTRCEKCGRADVGEIEFSTVASGVHFCYCRHCEHRWWVSPTATSVELDDVLRAAATLGAHS